MIFLKSFFVYCFAIFSLFPSITIAFEKDSYITEPPKWIDTVSFDVEIDVPLDEISNGIYYILVDKQAFVPRNEEQHIFSKFAYKLINDTGVEENAQLNFNYDPRYERIMLHELNVWRNGKKETRVSDSNFALLHKEDEKNKLIYDGKLTLNIVMNDLKVGDIVEYSYSRIGSNPILQNKFSFNRQLNWSIPVGSTFVRILWGKDTPLYYKIDDNLKNKIIIGSLGELTEYRFELGPTSAVLQEDNTPYNFSPWQRIFFSEFESWQGVVDLMVPLYTTAAQVDDGIKKLAADITRSAKTSQEQVAAILRYVQDDIRYLGIEIAENAFMPTAAGNTVQRGYGDCKDKTVLTISLLKVLDIDAYPILVDTENRNDIQNYLPTIGAFNHVIVYLDLGGSVYWLDPTRKYQYGQIDTIYQPNYETGLLVRHGENDLISSKFQQSKTFVTIHDMFDLTQGVKQGAVYTSKTVYGGYKAEEQRRSLVQSGLKGIRNSFYEYYQNYYPDIEVIEPVTFSDDQKQNRLSAQEGYQIKNIWEDDVDEQEYDASFYANLITPYLSSENGLGRKQPYNLTYPINLSQHIELRFKKGEGWFFEDSHFTEHNSFFNYERKVKYDQDSAVLYLDYQYQANATYVPAEDFADYLTALSRTEDYKNYYIYSSYAEEIEEADDVVSFIFDNLEYILLILYLCLLILLIYSFYHQKKLAGDVVYYYYPVSFTKFFILWVVTFGFYSIFWFYKNWQFYKQKYNKPIMPLARAIFYPVWFYILFKALKAQSEEADASIQQPSNFVGVACFISIWIASIFSGLGYFPFLMIIVAAFCTWPLASFINHMNGEKNEAYLWHSKWRVTSMLAVCLTSPLMLLGLGGEVGLLASDSVVSGEGIPRRDIVFLQRKNIVAYDDDIIYFYSDGFISNRADGNGFTDRHVFSYWEDDGEFQYRIATYEEIEDIEVDYSNGWLENTIIDVIKKDGESFLLHVSAEDKKDKRFVKALNVRWKEVTQ